MYRTTSIMALGLFLGLAPVGLVAQTQTYESGTQQQTTKPAAPEAKTQQFRKQMAMRVYKMLTRTSDDGSGMVPGTPFTKAGVTELMTVLRERAANEGAPGAKIAANAISFLKPVEADEESVAGASVTKLQLIARMASRFGGPAQ